jgi:hypothetical protein
MIKNKKVKIRSVSAHYVPLMGWMCFVHFRAGGAGWLRATFENGTKAIKYGRAFKKRYNRRFIDC